MLDDPDMAKKVLRTAIRHIHADCRTLTALARQAMQAAQRGEHAPARVHIEELVWLSTRHVRHVESFLPDRAQRRLRADHHRLAQLARSAQLDAGDSDWPRLIDRLQRLTLFLDSHQLRESEQLPLRAV